MARSRLPAPRASHVLDWTRDLIAAAESPLVPCSSHTGGALIAIDPNGQEAKLSLRKYHIDVYIEDGFARTTIDQTYFNHEPWQMQGTFYFPLPPDVSLSRLAMYVDGNLMEGGMAERDYARQVFETIMYQKKDPALLEWVDGSTFKIRIFPLEGRQEKRIVLSYTQRLPVLYGRTTYRFPAGHSLGAVGDWSFHANIKNGTNVVWSSDSHTMKAMKDGTDLILDAAEKDVKPDRDVTLYLSESEEGLPKKTTRFSSAEHEGTRDLMLRYRPELPSPQRQQGQRRDWVFLFESSGDRDPLLARTQIEIVRSLLLAQADPDDTFAVLTAGTRVKSVSEKPQAVTPENVEEAIAFLEQSHLIGALDLNRALTEAEPFLKAGKNPYLVHLGSGVAAMGERREDVLAKRIPDGTHYVGIGVGKRWARTFMKTAAARTGGYFTQINPDESIGWRAFDLAATLNTPRLLDIKVEDSAKGAMFLTDINSLAQGEELWAVARLDGRAGGVSPLMPESVIITGSLNGSPFRETLQVKDATEHADYLPRTWAKLEIDRLLAEDSSKNKDKIVALSKAMYVMTPFTSLLVLENEDMYTQFKVDRGRKDHWAMYPCPQKIKVVYERLPWQTADARNAPKDVPLTAEQVLQTIVVRLQSLSSREAQQWDDVTLIKPLPAGGFAGFAFTTDYSIHGIGSHLNGPDAGNAFRSLASDRFSDWSLGMTMNGVGVGHRVLVLDHSGSMGSKIVPYTITRSDGTREVAYKEVPYTVCKTVPVIVFREGRYYTTMYKPVFESAYKVQDLGRTRLGGITIVGNQQTRQDVILNQILVRPGQVLDYAALHLSEERLARLGIFEGVQNTRTGSFMIGPGITDGRDWQCDTQFRTQGESTISSLPSSGYRTSGPGDAKSGRL